MKKSLLILFTCIMLTAGHQLRAQVLESDSLALVELYNSTDGENWVINTNWLQPGQKVEDWSGLTVTNGRVTSLRLGSNQLSGMIPTQIGNLTSLEFLFLDENQLSGQIPVELGNLTNLKLLQLGGNQLQGSIPVDLGNLTKLTDLWLLDNQLSGSIPIELRNLTDLDVLNLRENQFSGTIPSSLGDLNALTVLELTFNQLSGSIPEELANLTNLEIIGLSGNELSGSIPEELTNLTNLGGLVLSSNQLTGMVPAEFTNLAALTRFNINDNPGLCEPATMEYIDWVTGLDVYANSNTCQVQDNGTLESDSLALVALYNATNGHNWTNNTNWLVAGQLVEDWFGVTIQDGRVTELDLGGNGLNGIIPTEVGNLEQLNTLFLSNNSINGTIPSALGGLSNLNLLGLRNNDLTGSIPIELGNLLNLTFLGLDRNQLDGSIPLELGSLNKLENLSLIDNLLSGSIPSELGSLSELTDLRLDRNQLSGTIPTELGGLIKLLRLTLQNNNLSGNIPLEIGNLSNLQNLQLFDNQLTGEIPSELGDLTNLSTLELYDNQLTGTIPEALGEASNLSWINISGNQLSGFLPSQLSNLVNLSNLFVSDNLELEGEIPIEFTNLENLATGFNELVFSNTLICEPSTESWLNWKENRNIRSTGIVCGEANLFGFSFQDFNRIPIIDQFNRTININLPNIDLSALIAIYQVSPGATISINGEQQISGETPADFMEPVTLLITSEDEIESTVWTISVSNQPLIGGVLESQYNALVSFYNATNGANWNNNTDWLSEAPVENWYGVTVENDRVKQLNLGSNELSGQLPNDLGILTELRSLYLWNNGLSGPLPNVFSSLSHLINIDVSINHLEGPLPESLSDLDKLESLFIRDNRLSGTIPQSFIGLTKLKTFNYSNNPGLCPQETPEFVQWYNGLNFSNSNGTCLIEGNFLTFSVAGETAEAVIDEANRTVTLISECPEEQFFRPIFTLSQGSLLFLEGVQQFSGLNIIDFTDPVEYVILPGFGSQVNWTVTVQSSGTTTGPDITIETTDDVDCTAFPDGSATVVNNNAGDFTYFFYEVVDGVSPIQLNCETVEIIENPASGNFVIDFQDSYGDGWNGASIDVIIDGSSTSYTLPEGSIGSAVANVPANSQSLAFEFSSGDWDSEVTAQIYAPSGYEMASISRNPLVGPIPVYNCLNDPTLNGLSPGTYLVEIIDATSGCASYESFVIAEADPEYIIMAALDNQSSCIDENGTILINTISIGEEAITLPDERFVLMWSDDALGNSRTGLSAGNYEVAIDDTQTGCSTTETFEILSEGEDITVDATVIAQKNCVVPNGAIMINSLTVDATTITLPDQRFTVDWDDTDAGLTRTGLEAGSYSVTITDTQSGCTYDETFNVASQTLSGTIQVASVSNVTSCTTSNGAASVTVDGTTDGFDFEWFAGGSAMGIPISTSAAISGRAAGSYTVKISETGSDCFSTRTIGIGDERPTLSINLSSTDNLNCTNPNGVVSIASIERNGEELTNFFAYDIMWSTESDVSEELSDDDEVTGLAADRYYVQVTDRASGCISAIASIEVEDAPTTPVLTLTTQANTTCATTGNGEATITSETIGLTIAWYEGDEQTPIANETSATITGLASGSYRALVTNSTTGCTNSNTFTIADDLPVMTLTTSSTSNTNCINANGIAQLTDVAVNGQSTTSFDAFSIEWSTSNEFSNQLSSEAVLGSLEARNYHVRVTLDSVSCQSAAAEVTITDQLSSIAITLVSNTEDQPGAEATGSLEIETGEGATIQWYAGEEATGSVLGTAATLNNINAGNYTVEVTDPATGCTATATYEVGEGDPVDKAAQVITFELPESIFQDELPLTLAATSDQSLPITYSVTTGVGEIVGDQLISAGPGNVTITASNAGTENIETAEAITTINIKGNYALSGSVQLGTGGPPIEGEVIIYNTAEEEVSRTPFSNGVYEVPNLREGSYIIKIERAIAFADLILNTYYEDALTIASATEAVIDNDKVIDITVQAFNITQSGSGTIIGTVTLVNGRSRIVIGRTLDGTPLEGIQVYLVDRTSGEVVSQAVTDDSGSFSFNNVATGEYRLVIDAVGFELSDLEADIDYEESQGTLELGAQIGTDGLTVEVSVVSSVSEELLKEISIYPNPVNQFLNVEDPQNRIKRMQLHDLSGRLTRELNISQGQHDLSQLSNGVYLLRLELIKDQVVHQKIIVRR